MNAIVGEMIMTGASTRADGSLSLRFCTQEIPVDQKAALMELHGHVLKVLIQPSDSQPLELKEIKGTFDTKTPSQRLRGVLFVEWKQRNEQGEFDDYYNRQMNHIIDERKRRLAPV